MPTTSFPAKYRLRFFSTYVDSTSPSVKQSYLNTDTEYQENTDTVTRNANPDWQVQIADGVDASNAYFKQAITLRPYLIFGVGTSPILGGYRSSQGNARFLGSLPSALSTPTDTALRDLALVRLKRKLSSQIGQTDLLVPLAEIKEMRGLIRYAASITTKTLKALVDIRKTRGRSAIKYASDAWLAFNFGISPTLREIQDVSTSIDKYLNRRDRSVVLTGTASKTWLSHYKDSGTTFLVNASLSSDATAEHSLSYRYTCGFNILVESANNYGISEHFGLEFGALPATLWELVPYSWVVDYFTNVGEYMSDSFASPPGSVKYLTLNTRYNAKYSVHPYAVPHALASVRTYAYDGSGSFFSFRREKLATLPHIGLHFKSVDQIGKNAVTKLLNLAAVLIQRRHT